MRNNLEAIYALLKQKDEALNDFYKLLDGESNEINEQLVAKMLDVCELEATKDNTYAVITRVVNLREDNVVQALEAENADAKKINKIKRSLYEIVSAYHLKRQKSLIEEIERKELLTPFYMTLIRGVYKIGEILTQIQPHWTWRIVEDVNVKLLKEHKTNEEVMNFLERERLFEYTEDKINDRTYSVLFDAGGRYEVKSYAEVFPQMQNASLEFEDMISRLHVLEDEEFGQKTAYINYFEALKTAFMQTDVSKLLENWQDVDRTWMRVTSPIQVGHPLEYYEDHFRKAVALEWDIRLDDVKRAKSSEVKNDILYMYKLMYGKIESDKKVYEKCIANVERVSLHIGRPFFYYGAEFNGLFSAQVVPNDEIVSREYGKKIFAYADKILDSSRAKPFLKISKDIFGKEFLDKSREILFKNETLWHRVYETSTIGHEFGHILWLDEDSETVMNASGMFKNIEEFKATTGGLMAFFLNEKEDLKEPIMIDVIKRAVGLIAWMKTGEVEPYYCEGLIHLHGLFETEVLKFDRELSIDLSSDAYERMKKWYFDTYENLAKHYLAKKDAKYFLNRYAVKEEGSFMPVDLNVKYFVNYYWNLHMEMGRVIDESEDRNRWIY